MVQRTGPRGRGARRRRPVAGAEQRASFDHRRIRRALLSWYDEHRRDLPWRRTRDPYAIWISETMLQQTRVETVIPYYERFLERFPTVESLAEADPDAVFEAWTGLGYYSRARNLQSAARAVVRDHAGALPREAAALRGLQGIGRYTAGAVSSIAFDREEPLVDGNVIRVLARLLGVRDDVGLKPVIEQFWGIALQLVRGERPGDLNQALMELGATVCTPRSPRCAECPLARSCDARQRGDAESLPIKLKKTKVQRMRAVAAWVVRRNRVLAVQRGPEGLLANLWELPGGEIADDAVIEDAMRRQLLERVGLEASRVELVGAVEHLFTHRRLALHVFRCEVGGGRVKRDGYVKHRWLPPASLAALPQGGPTRKALALLGEGSDRPHRARLRTRNETGASA